MPGIGALKAAWFLWSLLDRPLQIVYLFDGVRELQPPRSESTGPVRRGASARNTRQASRSVMDQVQVSGTLKEDYRACGQRRHQGAGLFPTGGLQGVWSSYCGPRDQVAGRPPRSPWPVLKVPSLLTLGSTGVPETGSGRRHRSWSCWSGSKARSCRSRATALSKEDWWEQHRVFTGGFPGLA
jgi:hypothetical protein